MVKGFERERQDFFLFVNTNTRYNSKCMQTVDLLQTSIKIELELDKMSSFYYQLQFIVNETYKTYKDSFKRSTTLCTIAPENK